MSFQAPYNDKTVIISIIKGKIHPNNPKEEVPIPLNNQGGIRIAALSICCIEVAEISILRRFKRCNTNPTLYFISYLITFFTLKGRFSEI
jgi:hypothetical protein